MAAGLANPAMSSWAALTVRAKFVAGESVLILGATGLAGQLAVQIAKRLGARRVIAAGRNPAALEKLKALGADAVISLELERAALVAAFRREIAGRWGGCGAGLSVGRSGGECAGGDCAEGVAAFESRGYGLCRSGSSAGGDDYAGGSDAAELGSGDAGEWVWECFDRADYAAVGEFFEEAAARRLRLRWRRLR